VELHEPANGTEQVQRSGKDLLILTGRRHTMRRLHLSFVAALSILITACATGVIVPITEQNADLIQGRWEGRLVRSNSDGGTLWQNQVLLTIQRNTGEMVIGSLDFGKFTVEIQDHNVIITQPNVPPRRFQLRRKGSGILTLTSSYDSVSQGHHLIDTMTLVKRQ
jgi:hypothetical protein